MSAPFVVSQPFVPFPPPDGQPPGIDAGVLGLEARHTWFGEYGPVRLNHLWDDDGSRVILGRPGATKAGRTFAGAVYALTRIQGLHSRPESDDNRAQLTGRIGEVTYPSFQRGKTVTYEGTIRGATLADLRRAETQLRRATAGTYESFMLVEPHPSYGSIPYGYYARCTQLDMVDELTTSLTHPWGVHQRAFILAFRMSDPRFYVWQQQQQLGLSAGAAHTVTSAGGAPTDPVITVHPASGSYVSNLEIHNDTTSAVLALDPIVTGGGITSSLLTGTNGHVTIDFRHRTIKNETGFSLLSGIDVGASTWWDEGQIGLAPEDNDLRLASPPDGTFDVQWLDASW